MRGTEAERNLSLLFMHRWFVSYCYRLNSESSIKYANCVVSTLTEIFSFIHVAQDLADKNNWSDVVIINYKQMSEQEFCSYEFFRKE